MWKNESEVKEAEWLCVKTSKLWRLSCLQRPSTDKVICSRLWCLIHFLFLMAENIQNSKSLPLLCIFMRIRHRLRAHSIISEQHRVLLTNVRCAQPPASIWFPMVLFITTSILVPRFQYSRWYLQRGFKTADEEHCGWKPEFPFHFLTTLQLLTGHWATVTS